METLSEFLKSEENQSVVLSKIISQLRISGEWGAHGLYAKMGKEVGLSPAYVGQVFNRKRPATDAFVRKMADYLGVYVGYFKGEVTDEDAKRISRESAEFCCETSLKSLEDVIEMYSILPDKLKVTLDLLTCSLVEDADLWLESFKSNVDGSVYAAVETKVDEYINIIETLMVTDSRPRSRRRSELKKGHPVKSGHVVQ